MENTVKQPSVLRGAEWLVKESTAAATYIPEEFNEEQQMVKDMCGAFLDTEVLPLIDRIDKLEPGLMPSLMIKAGEQGLLSTSIPEALGGLGKDFITSTLVNEALGGGFSFSVAVAAHTGIGTCLAGTLVALYVAWRLPRGAGTAVVAATAVLGYVGMSVPPGGTSGGNLIFMLLMIGLTLAAIVVSILHPIAWTVEEVRFAVGAPLVAGAALLLVAFPLGLIGSAPKRARFLARLTRDAVPATAQARLTCPIGLAAIPGSGILMVWEMLRWAALNGRRANTAALAAFSSRHGCDGVLT